SVPAGGMQEPLGAVGIGITDRFPQLPAILAGNGTEQRPDVAGAAFAHLAAVAIGSKARVVGHQLFGERVRIDRLHRAPPSGSALISGWEGHPIHSSLSSRDG